MPKIWADTIDRHRRQVTEAILDATAEFIAKNGPMSLAMSAIAERAGIGRATLYKYFPDVQSILVALHARDFALHLHPLETLSDSESVGLEDLAEIVRAQRHLYGHHKQADLVSHLAHTIADFHDATGDAVHPNVISALTVLLTRLAQRGQVRLDHDPEVLARWLLHAVHAPSELDDDAVSELVVDSLAPGSGSRRRHRP